MKSAHSILKLAVGVLAIGLAVSVFAAEQQPTDSSAGDDGSQTWGMMGGGYGMGQGMMGGGYGMGQGMMGGGYGMGQGMMGRGYGMGYGMMGGCGMGAGMMGGYWTHDLNLTDAQQKKLNDISDQIRKQHWALMGAMMDQRAKLRDLYTAPKLDNADVDKAYAAMGKLHQQMFDSMQQARKQMRDVLTPEQQQKMHDQCRRSWAP